MLKTTLIKNLTFSVAALALASQGVSAETLRLAPGTPPAHPGHTPLFTSFQEQLPEITDGELTGNILGTEVANLGNMRTAIRSGLADVGMFLPAYFPSDLSEINLVGDLAFLGENSQAMGAAMTEYIVNCDPCQQELKQLGVVYTTSHASDLYQLLTTTPVRTLDDLQGLRLRVGGPQFARWADTVGATGSNTSVGETFEAISQGVLDGTIASSADLISFRLDDVVEYITTIRLGTYHSTISHAIGVDTWSDLSPEHRKAMANASSLSSALATQRWAHEMPSQAEQAARDSGIEFIEPSQDLVDATREFASNDLEQVVTNAEDRYGLDNVPEKIERFQTLVDKWTAYAEEVDNDPQMIADKLNADVWDNVDFSSYGL